MTLLTLDSVVSWSLMVRQELRHQPHVSKQTVGILVLCVLNFAIFFFLKETFWEGNQVRIKYKKYERYKSSIASIYFVYTLLAFFFFYPDGSQTFFSVRHRKLDTEWPSSILTDFLLLCTAYW